MALSPWPERSTMPVAWPAAIRQLAASLNQSVPETGSLTDDATSIRLDQLAGWISARAEKEAPGAPQRSSGRGDRESSWISPASGHGGDPVEEGRGSGD